MDTENREKEEPEVGKLIEGFVIKIFPGMQSRQTS